MSENPGSQPVRGADRTRKWIGPALLVSLGLNLFLIGTMAAGLFFRPPHPPGEFGPVPSPFWRMLHKGAQTLPPDDRAAMRKIMIQEFPIIRPYFARIETARKNLADEIGANPYDPAKVNAAFAEVDAVQAEMIKATRQAMIEGFGKMKPEQRSRIAEAMRKQAERHIRDSKNPPPPPPGAEDDPVPLPVGPGSRPVEPHSSQDALPPPPPPAVADAPGSDATPPAPDMPHNAPDPTGLGFMGGAAPGPGPMRFDVRP